MKNICGDYLRCIEMMKIQYDLFEIQMKATNNKL